MLFWILSALLTVAVAVLLLLPLMRAGARTHGDDEGEAAVYRDQLRELERDKAGGLISAEDAAYARAEIGRRLLAVSGVENAADAAEVGPEPGAIQVKHKAYLLSQAFIILCLPAVGLYLYLLTGSPGTPAAPLAARIENPGDDVTLLIAKVERHLATSPEDGAGWDVLAPVYVRVGRLADAELAYRNAIRLLGPSADRMNGLAETLVTLNDGIVTEDARQAFEASVKLQPDNPRADYYLALALEQAGRKADALVAFQNIAKASPPTAPWMDLINRHIEANSVGMPLADAPVAEVGSAKPLGAPTAEDVAAAQGMSEGDRSAMIRGMVDSLDAKLKEDPNNFEGWMRLVRSHAMLKQPDRAVEALKEGLKTFPASGAEGQQLIAAARDLGLAVEEIVQ
ncbi:c-type cytochrome biogenesis protein CcmI [Rhizobium sp. 18065]|uniref:c-type cytochrome biogenesis protein CcmI n=1 Tax=Rhizobium sp. 18065 TaxID=2681411 RepID=UPI0013594C92|nr:c-type cytochrome biogenesis protein CcmI [Rhizobium sp. 18065]